MQQAMGRVLRVAREKKDWVLMSLAVRTKLDAFVKVKAAMDKMLAELKAQQKNEYEKHERCNKELDSTEDDITESKRTKSKLEEKKLGIENTIETLNGDIESLKDEITE